MKKHLLGFVISVVAFVVATFLLPGLSYQGNTEILIKSGVVFALLNTFVRPVIHLLLMPLNFLTLGLLGGLTGLILLWLLSVLVPGFSIGDSNFAGYVAGPLSIPPYQINSLLTALFGASLIGIISTALFWLVG